jgi:hypothetical protein
MLWALGDFYEHMQIFCILRETFTQRQGNMLEEMPH